jgi:hypothetical protein
MYLHNINMRGIQIVDVARRHLKTVLDEVLEHGKPHASDANDADALLRSS